MAESFENHQEAQPVEHVFRLWNSDATISENIWKVVRIPAKPAVFAPLPDEIHPQLRRILERERIHSLYRHQQHAWEATLEGKSIVIATGTASGKTLCFNLPVLDACFHQESSRALYIYPTKALAQDQYEKLVQWLKGSSITAAVYDGDTPTHQRSAIRSRANIVLTNPDMLHMGILPHHTRWEALFRDLRYIVIDEVHTYRGVFGSHLANLLRRLKRIARFYGSSPQFIFTSATIGNPAEHASRLAEQPVALIDDDGAPTGERLFLIYNPPVIDSSLGIRASAMQESQRLLRDLISYEIQTIVFARTRRFVEILRKYISDLNPQIKDRISGYRSGYLPNQRRKIEKDLRSGYLQTVIATNALELGIDIGSMEASVLVGFPGTIASFRQQAGRAGRTDDPSIAVLVASSDPIDQFLARHPDYLFNRSPEQALIDPNNPLILFQQLECAAFELPFKENEMFGNLDPEMLHEILTILSQSGKLHLSGGRYFWISEQYPASQISLRNSSPTSVKLQVELDGKVETVGIVDRESAPWMVHPEAVYLHDGSSYMVDTLDLEHDIAWLTKKEVDYYTKPQVHTEIEKISEIQSETITGGQKFYGEIKVTTQVVGFKQIRWYTHENLGEGILNLPPSFLYTTGFWVRLNEETVASLRNTGLWSNDPNDYGPGWNRIRNEIRVRDHFTCQVCGAVEKGEAHHVHHKIPFRSFNSPEEANRPHNLITLCKNCHRLVEANLRIKSGLAGMSYLLHHLTPLFLMCDIGDIGASSDPQSPLAGNQPVVVIYDQVPGGIGLAQKLFEIEHLVMRDALDLILSCPCQTGCPSCVGPGGENGSGGKEETLAILQKLTGIENR